MSRRLSHIAIGARRLFAKHRGFLARMCRAMPARSRRITAPVTPIARVLQRIAPPRARQALLTVLLARRSAVHRHETRISSVHLHRERPGILETRTAVERLVERQRMLVERVSEARLGRERTGAGHTPPATTRTSRVAADVTPARVAAPPMHLARNASPAPADAASPDHVAIRPSSKPVMQLFPAATPRTEVLALPPQELSRVTEHVISQLDRRVLSYRERMGEV